MLKRLTAINHFALQLPIIVSSDFLKFPVPDEAGNFKEFLRFSWEIHGFPRPESSRQGVGTENAASNFAASHYDS